MVPTDWATLKTELATLAIRDDLADLIPNFIGYAENWINRELFSPERIVTATLAWTDNSAPLPSGFGGVKTVYTDAAPINVLAPVTPQRLRELYPDSTTGAPCHFAIEGETMLLGPWPAAGTVLQLAYAAGFTPLGTFATTNWLLTAHPDLYVNATLAEIADYTRDPDEANRYRAKAAVIAESINRLAKRRTINSGPLAASNPVRQVSRFVRC